MAESKLSPLLVRHVDPGQKNPTDFRYPRWYGGSASCMAVAVSHPFDLIKVRMQIASNGAKQGSIQTGVLIVRSEGLSGLYQGISAGFTRSLTYGTARIAIYEELKKSQTTSDKSFSIVALGSMAAVSGFIGAIIGTPSDIANIRMQNDKALPTHHRRNYQHVFDAWYQMKQHEGWRAFVQGIWPNCFRSGIMTASQLASYDAFKRLLRRIGDTSEEKPWIHFAASLLASLVATTVSNPMDVIRTQLMSTVKRNSVFTVVQGLFAAEGFRWIFRGWTPSFVRLGPQTIATLVFLEQHKRFYRSWTTSH
ncbi:uncharacterized protein N7477_003235 [Penicillium maclennaniae]|uniref:uncharacterized protein n=1 Tax=Penicillium maclennaniae TaxID=1343394 RepID=UPI00254065BB|nr:uncharacterized protein N7477_003235 [Penicillium maclennaniae]KAJ5677602.1 hypothetical protein N7477_003235 [Penicillium maclennaniae]